MANVSFRGTVGVFRKRQPIGLVHHGGFFWPPKFRDPPGHTASARPTHVYEHSRVDGMDLRQHRQFLLGFASFSGYICLGSLLLLDHAQAQDTCPKSGISYGSVVGEPTVY